jgi:hypothetical protein
VTGGIGDFQMQFTAVALAKKGQSAEDQEGYKFLHAGISPPWSASELEKLRSVGSHLLASQGPGQGRSRRAKKEMIESSPCQSEGGTDKLDCFAEVSDGGERIEVPVGVWE